VWSALSENLGGSRAGFQENSDKRRVNCRGANNVKIALVFEVLFGVIDLSDVLSVCLLGQFGSLVGCASPPSQSNHRNYYSWFRQAVIHETTPQTPNSLASSAFLGYKPGNQQSWEMARS
jgi:hypothetical protein